jgi:hypothetical protein
MEYTTMPTIAGKLQSRWEPIDATAGAAAPGS